MERILLHDRSQRAVTSPAVAQFLAGILADETPDTERYELLQRSRDGDRDSRRQLLEMRVKTTNNFVLATSVWAMFCQIENVPADTQVEWINETGHTVEVRQASQDGGKTTRSAVKDGSRVFPEFFGLQTDAVKYPLRDYQRGNIGSLAQKQFDIARDLRLKFDQRLYALISGSIGAFTLTGARVDRTYVPHPSIRSGVLPTTNALAIPSVGGATKFGFSTFDALADYAARWVGAYSDGDPTPTGDVVVPADQVIQITADLNRSEQQGDALAGMDQNGFATVRHLGRDYNLIPSNTIPTGYAWPRLNKPAVQVWLKNEWNQSHLETRLHENVEIRWDEMVMAAMAPGHWRPNLVRVEFNTSH